MSRATIIAFLLLLTRVAAANPAVASADLDRAKAHFEKGKASYESKDYKVAIDEYIAAFQIAPFPELVFNIGQAYRLAGKDARALEAYEMFLRQQPDGELALEAQGHVLAFKSKGVSASDELRRGGPSSSWSALDERIAARDAADSAAFAHRRQRFVLGGQLDLTSNGQAFAAVGGIYRRVSRYVVVEPRAMLGIVEGAEDETLNHAVRLEVHGRVLAFPVPCFFAGGGLGLGATTCNEASRESGCSAGAFATSWIEVGLLIGNRYEVSLRANPWPFIDDDGSFDRVVPLLGLGVTYHL